MKQFFLLFFNITMASVIFAQGVTKNGQITSTGSAYVSLATAQAVNRSKEVGIRKVLGSSKKQLIIQFLSETFLITLTSVLIAILFAFIALPVLNNLLQASLEIRPGFPLIAFLFSLIIIVTFLSGFYPAIVLSGFNPRLQNFAYRIDIGVGIFLLTILISEIIAWLTVGYQAIKAAVANPVKSLRTE